MSVRAICSVFAVLAVALYFLLSSEYPNQEDTSISDSRRYKNYPQRRETRGPRFYKRLREPAKISSEVALDRLRRLYVGEGNYEFEPGNWSWNEETEWLVSCLDFDDLSKIINESPFDSPPGMIRYWQAKNLLRKESLQEDGLIKNERLPLFYEAWAERSPEQALEFWTENHKERLKQVLGPREYDPFGLSITDIERGLLKGISKQGWQEAYEANRALSGLHQIDELEQIELFTILWESLTLKEALRVHKNLIPALKMFASDFRGVSPTGHLAARLYQEQGELGWQRAAEFDDAELGLYLSDTHRVLLHLSTRDAVRWALDRPELRPATYTNLTFELQERFIELIPDNERPDLFIGLLERSYGYDAADVLDAAGRKHRMGLLSDQQHSELVIEIHQRAEQLKQDRAQGEDSDHGDPFGSSDDPFGDLD